jgi:23S rRNA (adenine1618-N6)-methyltransferase
MHRRHKPPTTPPTTPPAKQGASSASESGAARRDGKAGLHPRNRHRQRYDLPRLVAASPALGRFVARNAYGDESIDFADPQAVKALNRAILLADYGVLDWDLPDGYLCPPIPGRVDYLHCLADLLASGNDGAIPQGPAVRILDVGVGANCIYPLLGQHEYGWRFLGSEVDAEALAAAQRIVDANRLGAAIELRQQPASGQIFKGVWRSDEVFAATLCNPPFHASPAAAQAGSRRKWQQLGKGPTVGREAGREAGWEAAPVLNFGGQGGELWCPGGELAFIRQMIAESVAFAGRCYWFTTLVSKEGNLPAINAALKQAGVVATHTVAMSQGQKKSRLVAWTFLSRAQQEAWRQRLR